MRRLTAAAIGGALTILLTVDPFGLSLLVPHLQANEVGEGLLSREDRADAIIDSLDVETAVPAEPLTGSWDAAAGTGDLPILPTALPTQDEQVVTLSGDENEPEEGEPAVQENLGETQLGGMDVTVTATDTAPIPEAVLLRVAGATETAEAGITGVLLEVSDASETPVAADSEVDLTVSYESFAGAGSNGNGDWASRLRIVWLPSCETAGDECAPVPLETDNDLAAQTVTATVPVEDGGISSARGALAVTAAASGSGGNWSATSLSPSATWGSGGSTGAFSWTLPIGVPPVAAGPTPELSISYSSASSDGKVASTNNQSGPIGEGFDITTGYVERSYIPCSQDESSSSNNEDRASGDLCWGPKNATLMFNGSAVELIQDDAGFWKSKSDDGSRVEKLTGSWNGGQKNEYWKVTTTDGIQYFFGRGKVSASSEALNSAWTVPVYGNNSTEACYHPTADGGFKDSRCTQVWRWNLEYVLDPLGNTMTYHYAKETNEYVYDPSHNTFDGPDDNLDTVSYVSGGRLTRIDYGTRTDDAATVEAPARVTFTSLPRCITNINDPDSFCTSGQTDTESHKWPDTPIDQICNSTDPCTNFSPAFFDRYRLAKISTSTYGDSAYQPVDSWTIQQEFVGQGDSGGIAQATGVMLKTKAIIQTGHAGTATLTDDLSLPANEFSYTFLPNRVDSGTDGQPPLVRPRVTSIRTESGGSVNVNYKTDCTATDNPKTNEVLPQNNDRLCYPVRYYPNDNEIPVTDYFHKYVVDTTVESGAPPTGGAAGELITGSLEKLTTYEYGGGAAWRKPTGAMVKPKEVTYSDFRGFANVTTILGSGDESSTTRSSYYRGLGTTLTSGPGTGPITANDHQRFQGQVFEVVEFNDGIAISRTVTKNDAPVEVAKDSDLLRAFRAASSTTYGFTFDAAGTLEHSTKTSTKFNSYSQPVEVSDDGDATPTSDDICTTITYAHEGAGSPLASKYLVSLPARTDVVAKTCGVTPQLPADLISSDTATYSETGLTLVAQRIDPTDGVGYIPVQTTLSYDARGRPLEVEDAEGRKSTVAYAHSSGGLLASMTSTTPDPDETGPLAGFTSTTTFNPQTGLVLSTTDLNGLVTSGTYDALGRLLTATYPQHQSNSPNAKPSVQYEYKVRANGLNSVTTRTLGADGTTQHVSVSLYDGLLRPFQTQSESLDAGNQDNADANARGRNVAHVYYDSAGNVAKETGIWKATGAPTDTAIVPIAVPPSLTTYEYDSAGRVTDQVFWVGTESNPSNEKWRTITAYDGATTIQVPPLGGVPQATISNARGRVVELREYLRNSSATSPAVTVSAVRSLPHQSTRYTYDVAGQRTQMRDVANNLWTYAYDKGGRQISATDPDAGTSTTTYDVADKVVTRTNGAGETLFYKYDSLGRTTELRDDSASGGLRAAWAYDTARFPGPDAQSQGAAVLGQLASATRFDAGNAYATSVPSYDTAYRPLSTTVTLPDIPEFDALATAPATEAPSFTTAYTYTPDGQVKSISLPAVKSANGGTVLGREIVTTSFDTASMPAWMSGGFGWGTYVARSLFDDKGRPTFADLGNTYGTYLTTDYEEGTNRLSALTLEREGFERKAVDIKYKYDNAGNVTSAQDQPTATGLDNQAHQDNQCFRYDELRRLKTAWTAGEGNCNDSQASVETANVGGVAPFWTYYTYDVMGNRTSMMEHAVAGSATKATAYTHGSNGAGPHQLTSMTETANGSTQSTGFQYDAAGNRVAKIIDGQTEPFAWDAEGELTGAGEDSNLYDASGDRLIRRDGAGLTVYLPGGQELVINGDDVSASRYYSFAGSTVAVRNGSGLGAVTSLMSDNHGSVVAMVPNTHWTASSITRVYSDPFGAVRGNSDVGAVGDRRFLGAVMDAGSGLSLLGARFYDQTVGRFISVDPLLDPALPAQFNAYVYSGNNPMTWADPTGESWNSFWGGVGKGLKHAWGATKSFVKKYQAEIVGGIVGVAVFAVCTGGTLGAGAIGCAVAAGAAGSAVTSLWKTQVSKTEKFSWSNLARDTVVGGAIGGLTGGAGAVLGAVVRTAMASPAGMAAKAALTSAAKTVMSKVGSAFSSTVRSGSKPAASGSSSGAGAAASNGAKTAAGACSFTGATTVLMADASAKAISDVKVGDLVVASDPESGEQEAKAVIAVYSHVDNVVDLEIDGEIISTTEDHPFWSVTDQRFERADDLAIGELVLNADGAALRVDGLRGTGSRRALAFNLSIEGIHTYHVGESRVLVHNTCTVLLQTRAQLQSKFKHAADFGVEGNYNSTNAGQFSAALNQHINSSGTRAIVGTYRNQPVIHYLDPASGLNVVTRGGAFISGWRLSPGQLANVLKHGGLGGG
ncbi:colicin D domain-containing protein [Glaciihabitans arcticus]|nr:colicin D domain-containing protein [Glaciihabitans arcticus]